jgi:hypothetical protein
MHNLPTPLRSRLRCRLHATRHGTHRRPPHSRCNRRRRGEWSRFTWRSHDCPETLAEGTRSWPRKPGPHQSAQRRLLLLELLLMLMLWRLLWRHGLAEGLLLVLLARHSWSRKLTLWGTCGRGATVDRVAHRRAGVVRIHRRWRSVWNWSSSAWREVGVPRSRSDGRGRTAGFVWAPIRRTRHRRRRVGRHGPVHRSTGRGSRTGDDAGRGSRAP